MKGQYKIIQGDATKPQREYDEEVVVIPHVCNNLGGFNAGFVVALNNLSPEPQRVYKQHLARFRDSHNALGETSIAQVDHKTFVANMIAQNGYISASNPKPLKYWALVKCMQDVLPLQTDLKSPFDLHCPKFGSLRSGGNWKFIEELIQEIWVDRGVNVTVYEYKK